MKKLVTVLVAILILIGVGMAEETNGKVYWNGKITILDDLAVMFFNENEDSFSMYCYNPEQCTFWAECNRCEFPKELDLPGSKYDLYVVKTNYFDCIEYSKDRKNVVARQVNFDGSIFYYLFNNIENHQSQFILLNYNKTASP